LIRGKREGLRERSVVVWRRAGAQVVVDEAEVVEGAGGPGVGVLCGADGGGR